MVTYNNLKQKVVDLKELTQKILIKRMISSLSDASNENLLKIAGLFEKLNKDDPIYQSILKNVKKAIIENHPSVDYMRRILNDIDTNCRDKFIENLVINGLILRNKKRIEAVNNGYYVPTAILISPTMRCNLNCVGCYAGNYSKNDDLSYELFDRIISEAEEMGVGIFTILGGEPLVIKKEFFDIAKKHNSSYFQFYTNGTLIDEKTAEEIRALGNILPVISIEGGQKETDERRGKGVYSKVMRAMEILKQKKVPFGYSVAVTNKNAEVVSSDEFLNKMIEKGAYIGWYFLYMPVGIKPDIKLMPTPSQRKMLLDRWKVVRDKKPIFIVDFWNDAPFVGGCIAGKEYTHINSKGDVEPCIFTHFAVDNIKNKPLKEIMMSGFFKELRKRQPFNDNLYMPCMWIDNPKIGKKMIEKFHAYPTHSGAETILNDMKLRTGINKYSKEVKKIYDPLWKEEMKNKKEC